MFDARVDQGLELFVDVGVERGVGGRRETKESAEPGASL
jgi:hypothetical protein